MGKSCCEAKTSALVQLREKQGRVLKIVLAINLVMFFVELTAGWLAQSTALMADSLDMLGDAIVYGFSLYVLHKSERLRSTAALLKGLIIVAFGLGVLGEVIFKIFSVVIPSAETMGVVGALALLANGTCLLFLTRHKDDDINLRSTYICSRNDIVSNTGVLVAAGLVAVFNSKWPDIIVGLFIAGVFLRSALPILSEAIGEIRKSRISEQS